MELIRSLAQLRPLHRGCVATIGSFDGVHLGHQAVFEALIAKSKQLNVPSMVISFEPQPQEYFADGRTAPARLTRFREKMLVLRKLAIDRVLCLRFNAGLEALSPEAFVQRVLADGLGVRYLIVGDDFRYGRGRRGTVAALQAEGGKHGFEVVEMPTYMIAGERVSSTRIRNALKTGNMQEAALLLGRPYTLCGRVAHGDQRGRTIGFPTANIHLHRCASPVSGVFAVQMHGVAAKSLAGVANLGSRPTVNGKCLLLEVHLFNFSENIYGRYVEVEFIAKLREERRFASFAMLRDQIEKDTEQARACLFRQ
ncbi:MAG: bifunctional riboflavin kinase/FAD synthetase [Gammaproteobacteria bacterium]|nr:bifunctional riboflavin kinase/FAD synthetase [Gammaproteobacteria bacterium]